MENNRPFCNPDTGACALSALPGQSDGVPRPAAPGTELIYVGDPMCSWCWGIAPALKTLRAFAAARGIGWAIVTGGLRAGGGDAWTPAFKAFLRRHWEEIGARTGQPFGFALLDLPHFDYDTEPACRAVVVAREMLREQGAPERLQEVFTAIQHKFYVRGEDPKTLAFYDGICRAHALAGADFGLRWHGAPAREATRHDFARCRQWGVNSFPTVLLRQGGRLHTMASGFATAEDMLARLMAA